MEIDGYIRRWRPRALDASGAAVVRQVVALVDPKTIDRTKTLLWTCTQMVVFARSVGLEEKPEVLFHPSTIERLTRTATAHMSPPARRTLRTNLRHLGAAVVPAAYPCVQPLSRERSKKPYSPVEVAAYLALADAQPTKGRRMRAVGLICLGAGCGIVGRQLAFIKGTDVVRRSGGMVVEVSGPKARAVPVLSAYQDRLLAVADFAKDNYLIGGADPHRRNVTYDLVSSLCGGIDLPRLETGRLRATWLATIADSIGLATFMAAAGIVCSQRLGDIIGWLKPGNEAQAVALLGAGR
ncbi:MAG: hypothetical protein LC749_00625 [Actinobacteria bacterium]|nr:hypothetical protein [Actinomycetota bacterium]